MWWYEGASLRRAKWARAVSHDRGQTWTSGTTTQSWKEPYVIDYASRDASAWAIDRTLEPQAQGWELGVSQYHEGHPYDVQQLTGCNVQCLLMPSERQVLLLANKINPRRLYCLRWDRVG